MKKNLLLPTSYDEMIFYVLHSIISLAKGGGGSQEVGFFT